MPTLLGHSKPAGTCSLVEDVSGTNHIFIVSSPTVAFEPRFEHNSPKQIIQQLLINTSEAELAIVLLIS